MKRLELININKSYPGCHANQDINLSVKAGEVHAILGENGAGKSTLMKIIYGVIKPDSGQFVWQGKQISIENPAQTRELGIGMVFQHFSLFQSLTVTENIALSLPKSFYNNTAELAEKIKTVSTKYGMALDPDRHVYSLSIGEQQRVEIVRYLLQDVKLLILDEPTAALTPQEVDKLFATLKLLTEQGTSILFISHKLSEVQALCDHATVLRAGKVSGHCSPKQSTTDEIARLMVDDATVINNKYRRAHVDRELVNPVLTINNLNFQSDDIYSSALKNLNLSLYPGEIVGIAGVAGNGQEELLKILSGEYLCKPNQLSFLGQAIGHFPPNKRRKIGISSVPEERLGRGAVPNMSLADNDLLTNYSQGLSRYGWLNWKAIAKHSADIIKHYDVRCTGTKAAAKSLSGGNLQKYIIGREIINQPAFLACSHPTWGVDINAARLIKDELIALRDAGKSVLIISEDIDELYQICDRIGAICHGELSPFEKTDEVPIYQLGKWMAGDFSQETLEQESAHV